MNPNSKQDDEDDQATGSTASAVKEKPNYPGPKPGVKYPLTVIYCGGFRSKRFFLANFLIQIL